MSFFQEIFSEKQKKILVFLLIAASVYFVFRFLLAVVFPFLFALMSASFLEPAAAYLNKKYRIPRVMTGVLILILFNGIFYGGGFFLVRGLVRQIEIFISRTPDYEELFEIYAEQLAERISEVFHLEKDTLIYSFWNFFREGYLSVRSEIIPWLLKHSRQFFAGMIGFFTIFTLIQVAVLLCIRERKMIEHVKNNSFLAKDIRLVIEPVKKVLRAYIRSESVIILVVTGELVAGLTILKNPYSLLLGIFTGLLDALPLFGTGTVLIPWFLFLLLNGKWKMGAGLALLYLICYFTREWLEPRLMGKGMGINSLESMVSVYAGLVLFGIWGLFLGPAAWIIIRELNKEYNQ